MSWGSMLDLGHASRRSTICALAKLPMRLRIASSGFFFGLPCCQNRDGLRMMDLKASSQLETEPAYALRCPVPVPVPVPIMSAMPGQSIGRETDTRYVWQEVFPSP